MKNEAIIKKIETLKGELKQLEANYNACLGAIQVLEQLLEEEKTETPKED